MRGPSPEARPNLEQLQPEPGAEGVPLEHAFHYPLGEVLFARVLTHEQNRLPSRTIRRRSGLGRYRSSPYYA